MTTAQTKKPATKGMGALNRLALRAATGATQEAPTVHIPLHLIDFDPNQPRIAFHAPDGLVAKTDQEKLEELAESIRVNELIHPITVSEKPDGRYLVRVGERRVRAHKLLERTTIEARVRNDMSGMRALALQMAENTDRADLTDIEIAKTIKRLITQSAENPEPLSKKEAAELIGKSAGYVTRYLAFGDEMLREKWVTPGYVDTVENLYHITTMPKHIQDLVYADLSSGKQEAPLSWRAMQYYKNLGKNPPPAPSAPGAAPAPTVHVVPGSEQQSDLIAAALANANEDGTVSGLPVPSSEGNEGGAAGATVPGATDGYTLPPEAAQDLRVPTFDATGAGGPSVVRGTPGMMANTAVPCRMPMTMLNNLVSLYGERIKGMDKIEAEFRIPSAIAVDLVRELTGETVEGDRVATVLAAALEKLRR